MSRYEEDLKPLLTAMMTGRHLFINKITQKKILHYFTMKLMVLDWTGDEQVFTQKERTVFFSEGSIPLGMQMIISYCPDQSMHSYYRSQFMEASTRATIKNHSPGKNVKTIAFGFGGIFVFALCIRDCALELELMRRRGWFGLAPLRQSTMVWPPLIHTSREDALIVAESLESLKKRPNVRLFDNIQDVPTE